MRARNCRKLPRFTVGIGDHHEGFMIYRDTGNQNPPDIQPGAWEVILDEIRKHPECVTPQPKSSSIFESEELASEDIAGQLA